VAGGAYVVVGVLAVLVVMALAYTLTANKASSRTAEAASLKQEADQAEARAEALGAFGDFASIKATRTSTVKQLAEQRFDWERMLRELSAVLPEGAWLQKTDASVTGEVAGAAAPTPGAVAAPVKPALSLIGCTPGQGDVAALMVRLRKLYLVDDVKLVSSERGESVGKPSIADCGRYITFDLLVTFSSAAPTEREAPLGRTSVPAKLGGGS
jgi:Tfp pilus assembly protein PilN